MEFAEFVREIFQRRSAGVENLVVLERVDSTNLLARRIVSELHETEAGPPGVVLCAWEQTHGRGRQGRSWASPRGKGIYVTLVRRVDEPGLLQCLPLAVGIALCRTLDGHLAAPVRLKWPNDVLVDGRKIGGVLIESISSSGGPVICLIGFGVNNAHSRDELPTESATSLRLEGVEAPNLAALALELVDAIEERLTRLGEVATTIADYQALSIHQPGDRLRCRLGTETVEGEFLGFDDRGFLRLSVQGNEQLLTAGEVIEA